MSITEVKKSRKKDIPSNEVVVDEQTQIVSKAPIEIIAGMPVSENRSYIEQETVIIDGEEVKRPLKVKKSQIKNELLNYEVPRYYKTVSTIGLSEEIVRERVRYSIVNDAGGKKGKTIPGIILSNLFTFFNMLFLGIAIALIIADSASNLTFLGAVIPNLCIGIFQEIKAKKTVEKLSLMSAPTTTVIRHGEKFNISIKEVVLDDIIYYKSGDQISCDCILIEGSAEANEALITGEADAIEKKQGDLLYSGSFISSGACIARADRIGKDNYIEQLTSSARKYQKPRSELLRTIRVIVKVVSVLIIPIGLAMFGLSLRANTLKVDLPTTAGSIIGMIPAGLFLLTSVALFLGVRRLAKKQTLVQELYCIEMLARVNVLCLDKTGTITDGTMRVCDSVEVKNYTDYTIREIIGSMMSAFPETNATSEALIKYYDKNTVLKPLEVIPFSSKRKYSAVTFEKEGTFIIGAPEFSLTDPQQYDRIKNKVERFSAQGCRVLVLAHTTGKIKDDAIPKTTKPLALVVIQDHIREDAAETIEYFKQNGVDVKVISGDNPMTVSEIAVRVGIENAERYVSLDGLTDDEVRDIAFDYTVFGRVTPNQKRVLVEALKSHKKTVAMTGDGVNDILALKEADCSIAMASGSEATRYVSHLVLMDSNFASMPQVVNEGRRVINNIQKTSTLYLVKTIFSVLLSIMYIILSISSPLPWMPRYPFTPKDLILIEMFINGIAALGLAIQPNHEQVKGRFINNIIAKAVPGALAIALFHGILYLLTVTWLEGIITEGLYYTIAILITTVICLIVLFRVCKPFNWLNKILYGVVVTGCLIVIFLANEFVGELLKSENGRLLNINLPELVEQKAALLLLLIFALSASWVMDGIYYLLRKMKIVKVTK